MIRWGPLRRSSMPLDCFLVRRILAATSASAGAWVTTHPPADVKDVDPVVLRHHIALMQEAGYLRAVDLTTARQAAWEVQALTSYGQEVWQSVGPHDRWAAVVDHFKLDRGGSASFDALAAYAYRLTLPDSRPS